MKTAIITLTIDGKVKLHKETELPYSEAKAEFNTLTAKPPKGTTSIVLWPSQSSKAVEFSETGRRSKFFKKPYDPKSEEGKLAAKVDEQKRLNQEK